MITAIDTSVLIDILENDPVHGVPSATALAKACGDGAVIVCDVVWAEVATAYQPPDAVLEDLAAVGVRFAAMDERSALNAAETWARYRRAGGTRSRIAADFLVGAHALAQADRLLTRDAGFHRKRFRGLAVNTPDDMNAG